MSEAPKPKPDLEALMLKASGELYPAADAVFIVTVSQPPHDASVGTIRYIRRGCGPAYDLMMLMMQSEIDAVDMRADVREIDPEDDEE